MKKQAGFAILEVILTLVVVGLIGFTGWYVWHSKESADKTIEKSKASNITGIKVATLGEDCKISAPAMDGKLFMPPDRGYSFCMPNGWVLNGAGTLASTFWQSWDNPTYKANSKPQLVPGGGGDGVKPLFITSSRTNETPKGVVNTFTKIGQLKGTNMAGDEYYGKQTEPPADGLGSADLGTVEHLYMMKGVNKTVTFDYFVLPGEKDNSEQVKGVVLSILNKVF